MSARDPVADLRRVAFLLERHGEASYRVRAFRTAAAAVAALAPAELRQRVDAGTLAKVSGIGAVTAGCVAESLAGREPEYLAKLRERPLPELSAPAAALRAALRGDCHAHSDWSDGGSPIEEMALAAAELGHEYLVLTDHSPRLTVARGLSAERLREQLDLVARINAGLPEGFRLLTGIEVDILADGSLDQEDGLLAELDVVVGSVHSGLRDPSEVMTARMLAAVANPHLDILGHCTGRRLVAGEAGGAGATRRPAARPAADRAHRRSSGRPESEFDADAVFAACVRHDKAVEINCRPDRLDPPRRLLRAAVAAGCRFSIDTDAHAPGQLAWQGAGCERAAECGVEPERVVNTWPLDRLLAWTGEHAG
jgi:putative hydrolase